MTKRRWIIRGYKGFKVEFEQAVPYGHLTEQQASELLARLAAQHLTPREVVSSSLNGHAKVRMHHLEVQRNHGGRYALYTTGDPHFTAVVEEAP